MGATRETSSIGKLTADVLVRRSKPNANVNPNARRLADTLMPSISKSQTVIDKWIQGAIHGNDIGHRNQATALHLPMVLKTLQRLRSSDRIDLYFALISKIQASQIRWISQNDREIAPSGEIPVEFYNEVSNVLYRISLKHEGEELVALSKFLLRFLASYQTSIQQRGTLKPSTKVYRNCLLPIARTESVSLLQEGVKLIPTGSKNIRLLVELAFYLQTSQLNKLSAYLKRHLLADDGVTLNEEEIDCFFTLFFNIMQKTISLGDENTSKRLMDRITKDWNYKIDDHHQSLLIEICERNAAIEVLQALDAANFFHSKPELKWKAVQSHLSWDDFMVHLCAVDVNLFKERQDLDFLQQKLATVGPTLKDWRDFLKYHRVPEDANPSLKALVVKIILVDLVSKKSLEFVMSVMEYILYEMKYCKAFLNTSLLVGHEDCSGFHCLFKAISRSRSSILTSFTLFKFLRQNQALQFNFTTKDYFYMMRTCLNYSNPQPLYFFLFEYIMDRGSSLYQVANDGLTWALPPMIEKLLLSDVPRMTGDRRVVEIIEQVRDWYLNRYSNTRGTQMDKGTLKHIFDEDYVPELTIASLLDFEREPPAEGNYQQHYSPSADIHMSNRLRDMLKFIERSALIA